MTFDPRLICSALDAEGVRFVLVGGFAAAIHGSPLPTSDVDIVPARDDENLERLAPQRRVDRLERERCGRPEPRACHDVHSAIELLNYRPEESPSEWTLGNVERFGRIPLEWLPRLYQIAGSVDDIQDHVLSLLMMRILVTPDALELRRDLWDAAPSARVGHAG